LINFLEKFFTEGKKILYSSISSYLLDSFSLNSLLIEINNPDKNWTMQNRPSPQMNPQTHLVRLRSIDNYKANNQNFIIKGNKYFYSNLFLFNGKNSAFEIDDLDAFFFDKNYFKVNFHFLNVFKRNNNENLTININNFGKINLVNYIKTQIVINRFIPMQSRDTIKINNPRRNSEWQYDVYVIYKIDESFESDLNTNDGNTIYSKDLNNEPINESSEIIDSLKVVVLDNLINEKNFFDFELFKETNLNMVNFNVLNSDPLDINIRYTGEFDYTNEQKLNSKRKNNLLKSVCYDITNLSLNSEKLKGIYF